MRHDKFGRELRLLFLLIENHSYTVDEICDRIEISRRNFYYYLEFFRFADFIVEHHRPYYYIRKDSPFFRKLDAAVHFTEDEAIMMHRILQKSGDMTPQKQRLLQKLNKLYDLDIVNSVELREQVAHNVSALYTAIKEHRCCILRNYSSPHSNTTTDRSVEPFLLMNGNQEIRCFEPSSMMNKTFKISRIGEVEVVDLLWSNQQLHRKMYTDVFMFSGEKMERVKLRMGRLATNILQEEYPRTERYIEQEDEDHWLCKLPVCSYIGIGRFVLGLYEDIEVLGNAGFRRYLSKKIKAMGQHLPVPESRRAELKQ